jgi:2-dehydro-3-deoxyphosphogluconate aldolase / (4S)-4-hydroxy-2-oxoglutarate aldolase
MRKLIKQQPVIAILRHTPEDDLENYVNCLYEGGLRSFEVSFSTKNAISQLKWMKLHMPKDAFIGAGTILTEENAAIAADTGADFLLSPSTNEKVLKFCANHDIRFLPGVYSPTEVSICLAYGYSTLKLFPAGDLPKGYTKSLHGPYPDTEYVAVGGISPVTAAQYLEEGFVGVGIGSSLVDRQLLAEKKWSEISGDIKTFLKGLRKDQLL